MDRENIKDADRQYAGGRERGCLYTHKLSTSENTHSEHTQPRSILVSVYSCATDQITCDTGMKSGQAPSFSLLLTLSISSSVSLLRENR